MRLIIATLCLLTSPALAQDAATADQIRAALEGNTVIGSMSASGAYTEYYAADGTIKAADYAGKWAIEGDTMCFTYGDEAATCWAAQIAGDQVTWLVNGVAEGTGSIQPGNPNGW